MSATYLVLLTLADRVHAAVAVAGHDISNFFKGLDLFACHSDFAATRDALTRLCICCHPADTSAHVHKLMCCCTMCRRLSCHTSTQEHKCDAGNVIDAAHPALRLVQQQTATIHHLRTQHTESIAQSLDKC